VSTRNAFSSLKAVNEATFVNYIHGFFSARPRFWMRVQRSLPGIRFAAGENVAVSVTYSDGTVESVVAAIGGRVFIFRELPSPHGKVAKFGKGVEGPELVGPSAGHWGRQPGEYGRLAFFTTDGGTASPPKGGPQPAKLVKVELLTEAAVR
jgi:hypothetical protein